MAYVIDNIFEQAFTITKTSTISSMQHSLFLSNPMNSPKKLKIVSNAMASQRADPRYSGAPPGTFIGGESESEDDRHESLLKPKRFELATPTGKNSGS